MQKIDLTQYKDAVVGNNVEITCDVFECEGAFYIGDNVRINAKKIYIGNNARVERDVSVRGLRDTTTLFSIGDESLIGFNTQVMVPEYIMGDYSQVFNSCLLSGYKPIKMGHNCWIGQGAILNSAELLTLGNNVRMGGSQIWTHVASGELLEGSNFYSEKPVTIEDNVWLMGFGHMITPGVTLGRNSVIMAGSVVTKSTEAYKTYSGVPAIDISNKIPAWKDIGIDEKYELLCTFVDEFIAQYPQYKQQVFCFHDAETAAHLLQHTGALIFLKQAELSHLVEQKNTIFDLSTKRYLKQRSEMEVKWMKFANGYRARFIPYVA